MIEVSIISSTPNPVDAISIAAGTSYGKRDVSAKRMYNCFKAGHTSVLEHASVTFRVSGISRACSHQLVRHRLASYVQKSQRYTKIDTDSDWYVMPPMFVDYRCEAEFRGDMEYLANEYMQALKDGIKARRCTLPASRSLQNGNRGHDERARTIRVPGLAAGQPRAVGDSRDG